MKKSTKTAEQIEDERIKNLSWPEFMYECDLITKEDLIFLQSTDDEASQNACYND